MYVLHTHKTQRMISRHSFSLLLGLGGCDGIIFNAYLTDISHRYYVATIAHRNDQPADLGSNVDGESHDELDAGPVVHPDAAAAVELLWSFVRSASHVSRGTFPACFLFFFSGSCLVVFSIWSHILGYH